MRRWRGSTAVDEPIDVAVATTQGQIRVEALQGLIRHVQNRGGLAHRPGDRGDERGGPDNGRGVLNIWSEAMTTRRSFLRGAAGVGTVGLMPAVGWAAAGGPDYLAAAGLPRRRILPDRADGGGGRGLPAAAAGSGPRGGGAAGASRGGGLRAPARDLRGCDRLRRGARGGAAARAGGAALLRARGVHRGRDAAVRHREPDRRRVGAARRLGCRGEGLPEDRRGGDGGHGAARGAADAGRASGWRWRTEGSRQIRARDGRSSTSRPSSRASPM